MKIVYCTNALYPMGGIETVTITKANALASYHDNSVWIVTCCDDSLRTCIPLSDKVGVIGIKPAMTWGFPWNLFQFVLKKGSLRNDLKRLFSQIHPDIVISTGGPDRWVIPSIKGDWSTIREVHNVLNIRQKGIRSEAMRLYAGLVRFLENRFINNRFDRIVVLTQEDQLTNWKGNDKMCVIPNPVRLTETKMSTLENKRVVAVGRLTSSKNFSSLLRVFSQVIKRCPEWKLDIYGEGEERDRLSSEISSLGLSTYVRLMGNASGIQEIMQGYSILASSSIYESFGVAIVEAMSCGLPVVSYACPYGPGEIITDGANGFLVPVGDEVKMADAICKLMENPGLRRSMGAAAFERSKDFRMDHICKMWNDLFHKLKNER